MKLWLPKKECFLSAGLSLYVSPLTFLLFAFAFLSVATFQLFIDNIVWKTLVHSLQWGKPEKTLPLADYLMCVLLIYSKPILRKIGKTLSRLSVWGFTAGLSAWYYRNFPKRFAPDCSLHVFIFNPCSMPTVDFTIDFSSSHVIVKKSFTARGRIIKHVMLTISIWIVLDNVFRVGST